LFNETLLTGTLAIEAESRQTSNGKLCATARIETLDVVDDGRIFKTWIPIVAYSKAAKRPLSFAHGDLLIGRGKVTWSVDQGGLIGACRHVSKFAMPGAEGIEPDA
jgi:single-stranded DNA-binding protein